MVRFLIELFQECLKKLNLPLIMGESKLTSESEPGYKFCYFCDLAINPILLIARLI